jgi:hypothetical protein
MKEEPGNTDYGGNAYNVGTVFLRHEVNSVASGSCPVAVFVISGVECWAYRLLPDN